MVYTTPFYRFYGYIVLVSSAEVCGMNKVHSRTSRMSDIFYRMRTERVRVDPQPQSIHQWQRTGHLRAGHATLGVMEDSPDERRAGAGALASLGRVACGCSSAVLGVRRRELELAALRGA